MVTNRDVRQNNHVKERVKRVLSTREEEPGEQLLARVRNIRLVYRPVREYKWITPPFSESGSVLTAPFPDAWVFTSRRGVEGWWRIWKKLSEASFSNVIPPVYVIGDKTEEVFRELFVSDDVKKADINDGTSLGLRMVNEGIHTAVHFCSTDRREELRQVCQDNGISLEELEVYQDQIVTNPEPLTEPVEAVLFFSPKGVAAFHRLYKWPGDSVKAIAIGSTTTEAVRQHLECEPLTASLPALENMLDLV